MLVGERRGGEMTREVKAELIPKGLKEEAQEAKEAKEA